MEREPFGGNHYVTVRKPFMEGVWQDLPLKGVHPDQIDSKPEFAYVEGEEPKFGRVHTNFEGEKVTEIKLDPLSAYLIR